MSERDNTRPVPKPVTFSPAQENMIKKIIAKNAVPANIISSSSSSSPSGDGITLAEVKADTDIASAISLKHAIQDLSGLQVTTAKGSANGYAPLDASSKVPVANLPDVILGSVNYHGAFSAAGGIDPTVSPTALKGDYFVISVGGTINAVVYLIGDWIIYSGSVWERVDNSDKVSSVNGAQGAVVLNQDNIGDGTTYKQYSNTDKTKLAGIEASANNYTHPGNHAPSIITQDASNRFVTDTEKSTWNGKSTAPNDAQKNSDITKAEIEAKLIGEVSTHSHAGGGAGMNLLKKTNYQVINSGPAVFIDISGLTFPVVNGVDYAFYFYIVFQSSAIATGWKAGVNCPTGALDFWATSDIIANGAAGVATHTERHNVVRDDMTLLTGTVTANVDLAIEIRGRYICTQNGTFACRFANELANDTNLVVQRGSWGWWF